MDVIPINIIVTNSNHKEMYRLKEIHISEKGQIVNVKADLGYNFSYELCSNLYQKNYQAIIDVEYEDYYAKKISRMTDYRQKFKDNNITKQKQLCLPTERNVCYREDNEIHVL